MKMTIITMTAFLTLLGTSSAFAEQLTADGTKYSTAGAEVTIATTGGRPTLTIKPSTNVSIVADTNTFNGKTYTMGTTHAKGTKVYAASSGDTKIYMAEAKKDANGVETVFPPKAVDEGKFIDWAGWTGN